MRSAWIVILSGALIVSISMGVRQTFGLFLRPVTMDLQIGREVFGLALAIQGLVWGLASPFAGAISDRYGTGLVLAGGGVLFTASCSFHLSRGLFFEMLSEAVADSGRRFALRAFTGQPLDHPELINVPETGYLKGAVLEAMQ